MNKIKSDKNYVTVDEARAVYIALLDAAKGKLERNRQESTDECSAWRFYGDIS